MRALKARLVDRSKKGIQHTIQDTTELSLQESEIRYRRLFETAQDGILILDAGTGAITDVNPYLVSMLGYSRDEFLEKKLWEVGAFKNTL
jgi:PAS domain-containing protein